MARIVKWVGWIMDLKGPPPWHWTVVEHSGHETEKGVWDYLAQQYPETFPLTVWGEAPGGRRYELTACPLGQTPTRGTL